MNLMTHIQTAQTHVSNNKRYFIFLWLACIVGVWFLIPYINYLGVFSPTVSYTKLFVLLTAQTALIFGVICWLAYILLHRTDLSPFSPRPLPKVLYSGVIVGLIVGVIICLLNISFFKNSQLEKVHPPALEGLLASFYGGINEEVLLRLFFFTLVYFLFQKIFRFKEKQRIYFLWMTNVIIAILFGIGHLPMAYKLVSPSIFEVSRVLLLNFIPGIAFGWLYWSRGMWGAMAAHFTADILIHVLL